MATLLRAPVTMRPPACGSCTCLEIPRVFPLLHVRQKSGRPQQLRLVGLPRRQLRFRGTLPLSAFGETTETGSTQETAADAVEGPSDTETSEQGDAESDGILPGVEQLSTITSTLQSYREALANGDESTVSEVDAFLQSIEDEKNSLATKVAILSEELDTEKDRILRISADLDNFRKRTERERLSLMTNVQGEVVESLLPVLDNFERAKAQIKVETEGEEKINNSYQSIYKQFMEILSSLGVEAVETVGTAFDPMLHEAIMRGDSAEFEEGIILAEFRKGFKLGERLLRPSMVKVSAGPGPAKDGEPADAGAMGGQTGQQRIEEGAEAA